MHQDIDGGVEPPEWLAVSLGIRLRCSELFRATILMNSNARMLEDRLLPLRSGDCDEA